MMLGPFRWNQPEHIATPAPNTVDLAGFFDREGIASLHRILYQPATLPPGWVLNYAAVVPAIPHLITCPNVEIDYANPTTNAYLELNEFPHSCDPAPVPEGFPGTLPLKAGSNNGFIQTDPAPPAGSTLGGLYVHKTTFVISTTLSPQDAANVLATLEPFNLNQQVNPPPSTTPALPII